MEPKHDANAPRVVAIPFWGPDGYAVRMARRLFLRSNPVIAARSGRGSAGIRPAPDGSQTENTKTDGYLMPQQSFRSAVGKVADPQIKNVQKNMSYPNTTSPQVNPTLLALGTRPAVRPWDGFRGGMKPHG